MPSKQKHGGFKPNRTPTSDSVNTFWNYAMSPEQLQDYLRKRDLRKFRNG